MEQERLIQAFFSNTLSSEDLAKVNQLLKEDLSFKSAFEDYNDMQKAFKDNEKKHLKTYLNSFDQKSISFYNKVIKNKPLLLAIASCLILGLFYLSSDPNSEDLFNTYYESYPNTYAPIVRGDLTSQTKAFLAYENEDFSKAANEFKLMMEKEDNPNIKFYYVMALLNQDYNSSEVINVLNELKTETFEFLPETYWFSALVHVKNNNFIKAKIELLQLKKLNSNFKKEEQVELLNAIDKEL